MVGFRRGQGSRGLKLFIGHRAGFFIGVIP
jgi:hypothetical protein